VVTPWRRSDLDLDPDSLSGLPLGDEAVRVEATDDRQGYGVIFWVSVAWIVLMVFGAVFAGVLPLQPDAIDPFNRLAPIGSPGHLLGTDELGRDMLARIVYGARVSLTVGAASVTVGLTVGGLVGMIAGFRRGWLERVIMWLVDVLLSFPALVLLIAIVAFVGHSLLTISLAIGFTSIPVYARLARAHTLTVAERDFVVAARAAGGRWSRILWREIMPNVVPPLFAYGLIAVAAVIVVEGSLSFLGLSVSVPTPSWGGIIAEGVTYMSQDPAIVLLPSGVMCLTVLALNLAGDTLRRRHETFGRAGR
jgi:peptide/nickel transport system permease protein